MKSLDLDLLKELLQTYSPAGNETRVCQLIMKQISEYADEMYTDALGNLIVRKKGEGKKILLAGHMDQIGLMVTFIDDKGFIRFTNIGGISPEVTISQRIIFENGTIGVIGCEKIDNLKELSLDKLFIDIGSSSKEETEKKVSIGDMCVYYSETLIDDRNIISPAVDDRIGCFVMIETLKSLKTFKNDIYFVFTVQEEVGTRGAKTAAYAIEPDIAISLDITATGDTPKAKPMAIKLGHGPAVKIKDNSIICHPRVKQLMIEQAKKNSIPYQLEVLEFGGTDSGAIHLTRSGVPSGVLSIPSRYIHSNCEMVSLSDVSNAIKLLIKILEEEI